MANSENTKKAIIAGLSDYKQEDVQRYAGYIESIIEAKDKKTNKPKNPWLLDVGAKGWRSIIPGNMLYFCAPRGLYFMVQEPNG